MVSALEIYLIGVADEVSMFFGILTMLCTFVFGLLMLHVVSDGGTEGQKKWLKIDICLLLCFFFSATITPSSKTLAAMYVVPAVVNSERLQSVGSDGLEILQELTKQWLKDLKDEKVEQVL